MRAQTTHIRILAWHCLEVREGGNGSRRIKADGSDGSTEMGTGEGMKKCMWKQVPYPVVTACTSSCKLMFFSPVPEIFNPQLVLICIMYLILLLS